MFEITKNILVPKGLKEKFLTGEAGAWVVFEGIVRNHNEGKTVTSLEYESYEDLAKNEADKILMEAHQKFPIDKIFCFHRTGKLKVGETSLWVGVSSAHRKEAFEACQYIIDQIKARLPIWKKEYYENGDSGWINCTSCSHQH